MKKNSFIGVAGNIGVGKTTFTSFLAKEFDYNSKLTKYYRNVASWVIIMSLYLTFTGLYKYKIR